MLKKEPITLNREISILKRYKDLRIEFEQVFDLSLVLPEDKLRLFRKNLLNDLKSLGAPPLPAQAKEKADQIILRHFHTLDPNRRSLQEFTKALEELAVLTPKAQAIYESYRTELRLPDYRKIPLTILRPVPDLFHTLDIPGILPIENIANLIYRLEGLRHKKEREGKAKLGQTPEKATETPAPQAVKSVENTLVYDTSTRKFSFNKNESLAVSNSPRTRIANIAKELMMAWKKGRPCPHNKIIADPTKKIPQGVYNDVSKIRTTLRRIGVNMPQSIQDGYPPPGEPKYFTISRKKTD